MSSPGRSLWGPQQLAHHLGRQDSAASDAVSTPRLLARRSIEQAGHMNFPFHTPFEAGSICDQQPGPAAAEEDEPLLRPLLDDTGDTAEASTSEHVSYAAELRGLLQLAGPLMVQSLSTMAMILISTTFVGHLNSPTELSAVVLASSLYNVTGSSLIIGLAAGMETLCGQAYGARNYTMLGTVYQRAQVICWAVCIPIALLYHHMTPILLALGQHPEIVALSTQYLRILVPGLFLLVINETTRRYFLAQRVVMPGMVTYLVTSALSPLYNWFFIYRLDWRTNGAACAILSCTATNAVLLTAYRLYRDLVQQAGTPQSTWRGLSWDAFRGWGTYLSYGVPAAAMICLEWWVWEIQIVMAGLLPTASTAVGVMGLAMQISGISYMIPSSMGSATSTRVANSLGAGKARTAAAVARLSGIVILGTMVVLAAATYALRRQVVRIFTEEQGVIDLTAVVVPAVAASLVGDGMVAVMSGVLRAAGRQTIGVTLNLAGYWCVGVPLSYVLGFTCGLGILGFWIALAVAAGMQAVIFVITVARFDWQLEVKRARALTAKHQGDSAQGVPAAILPPVAEADAEQQALLLPTPDV